MSKKVQLSGIKGYEGPELFRYNLASEQGFVSSTAGTIEEYDVFDWGTI